MIAIDTGIWIEYINTNGKLHSRAKAIIDSVNSGKASAILTPLTLTEIFYVAKEYTRKFTHPKNPKHLQRNFTILYIIILMWK